MAYKDYYNNFRLEDTPLKELVESLPWTELERLALAIVEGLNEYQKFLLEVDSHYVRLSLGDDHFGDVELIMDRKHDWVPVSVYPTVTMFVGP